MAHEAAEIEASLPNIPSPPQVWTSDCTPERLGVLLEAQEECLAWLSSEGGIFDTLQGRYSSGVPNLDLILKCYSGDAERVDRGNRAPVFLRNPRLTIGLSPQPDVLRGLASNPKLQGRGLLERFFYLLPESPLGFRKHDTMPIPAPVWDAYQRALHTMLNWDLPEGPDGESSLHRVRLTTEAYDHWLEFTRRIEQQMAPGGELENLTGWAAKTPGGAARLAAVFHCIKHAHGQPWAAEVTPDTMTDAIEVMLVIIRHSIAAMNMMGADSTINGAYKVWHWIERNRLQHFTVRDAFQRFKSIYQHVTDLLSVLNVLEERGYIEINEAPYSGNGRPPSPIVRVRPELVRGW